MTLGFTESKVNSKLYFKVESGIPMILLIPNRKEELIKVAQRILAAEFEIKDLGMMHYVLGMEVWTRELCNRDSEEVQDDGMQGHGHTYGIEPKAIK